MMREVRYWHVARENNVPCDTIAYHIVELVKRHEKNRIYHDLTVERCFAHNVRKWATCANVCALALDLLLLR